MTTDEITAQILRAVNDCRRKLVRRLPKTFLRKPAATALTVSVANGVTYSLASDVQDPILFRYTSNNSEYVLQKVDSEREFYQLVFRYGAGANRPTHYFELGPDGSGYKQIQVYPTPDATYTVNYSYYKDPSVTELTTSDLGSTVPDIPSYLQDALVAGSLWLFLKCFDDQSGADRAQAEFQQTLIEADIAENEDSDSDLSFRFQVNKDYRSGNGIRLE